MKSLLKNLLPAKAYSFLKYTKARYHEPSRYSHLYRLIKETDATKILEIGVWDGERALRMIDVALRKNGTCEYYGFDLFEDLDEETFNKEISKKPLTEAVITSKLEGTGAVVRLYKGNTMETLPQVIGSLPKIDFVFIDGGHHVDTVTNDWKHVQNVMHDSTVVVFDDYWRNRSDHGARPVVDLIDKTKFDVSVTDEVNSFDTKDFGHLDISFAIVKRKTDVDLNLPE